MFGFLNPPHPVALPNPRSRLAVMFSPYSRALGSAANRHPFHLVEVTSSARRS